MDLKWRRPESNPRIVLGVAARRRTATQRRIDRATRSLRPLVSPPDGFQSRTAYVVGSLYGAGSSSCVAGDRPDLVANGLDEVAERGGLRLGFVRADADRGKQVREPLLDLIEGAVISRVPSRIACSMFSSVMTRPYPSATGDVVAQSRDQLASTLADVRSAVWRPDRTSRVREGALRGFSCRRSAELFGKPDEKSSRSPDVAEPIRVFVLDHLAADKLSTVLAEPGERLVDVVHSEHDP